MTTRPEDKPHWPDCAKNHGGAECDMGPECGDDLTADNLQSVQDAQEVRAAQPDEPLTIWRAVEPYNHEDGGDCMMTIQEFIDAVAAGAYTDDDGHGACATATQVSNHRIYPSQLDRPSWTTHVCWYNK